MFSIFLILFFFLLLSLFIYPVKTKKFAKWSKIFRISVSVLATSTLAYYFITKSLDAHSKNALTVQVINKLPFTLDFYLVKVKNEDAAVSKYETRHLGNIRSDFYRIDYLNMKNSDQFWIVAYMGNKNLVYFSQHAVPNKNEDQIIEIQNYINQSVKLSEVSKSLVSDLKIENMKTAVWITLDLLLLFLNFVLLTRKSK